MICYNPVEVLDHVVGPRADYSVAMRLDRCRSQRIGRALLIVLPTAVRDDKRMRGASDIGGAASYAI